MMNEVKHFHVNGRIHKQIIFINETWNVGNKQTYSYICKFLKRYFKLKNYSLYRLFYSVLIYVNYVKPCCRQLESY